MASHKINSRSYCDEMFGVENLERVGINPKMLRRYLPNNFTDVMVCAGNNFDIAKSK